MIVNVVANSLKIILFTERHTDFNDVPDISVIGASRSNAAGNRDTEVLITK